MLMLQVEDHSWSIAELKKQGRQTWMFPVNFSLMKSVFTYLFVFSESPNESSWALLLNATVEQPELRVG